VKGFSPRFTAPEVFGKVMADLNMSIDDEMKGDVYSYAIVVWQMITRKTPWANCKLCFSFLFFFFSFFLSFFLN